MNDRLARLQIAPDLLRLLLDLPATARFHRYTNVQDTSRDVPEPILEIQIEDRRLPEVPENGTIPIASPVWEHHTTTQVRFVKWGLDPDPTIPSTQEDP